MRIDPVIWVYPYAGDATRVASEEFLHLGAYRVRGRIHKLLLDCPLSVQAAAIDPRGIVEGLHDLCAAWAAEEEA